MLGDARQSPKDNGCVTPRLGVSRAVPSVGAERGWQLPGAGGGGELGTRSPTGVEPPREDEKALGSRVAKAAPQREGAEGLRPDRDLGVGHGRRVRVLHLSASCGS